MKLDAGQRLGEDDGARGVIGAGAFKEGVGKLRILLCPLRVGVGGLGRCSLGEDALQHGELGLRRRTAGHERHEIAGAHRARTGHFPRGGPAQSAGHGIFELVDILQQELKGTRIQLDEAVSQVIVVRQHEVDVRLLEADEFRNFGGGAIDIHLDALGAHYLLTLQGVDADGDAVRTQSIAALGEEGLGDGAGLVRLQRHTQRVDS